jgi:16S rRNA (cytidine1402-2'-O)-methyltransferase
VALVASGLPSAAFYFGGFLPRKAGERGRLLRSLAALDATLIFYESPRRSAATLLALAEAYPGRSGAMARELTNLHEEVVRGPLAQVARQVSERDLLKGEVVLLVGPPPAEKPCSAEPASPEEFAAAAQKVSELMACGLSRTAAVKQVARDSGMSRNALYDVTSRNG